MSNAAFVGSGSYPITPSDTVDLQYPGAVITVTTAGTVKYTGINEMVDTITLADGGQIPALAKRVWATGTTATGIHGFLP
jgi:hypothetical protein